MSIISHFIFHNGFFSLSLYQKKYEIVFSTKDACFLMWPKQRIFDSSTVPSFWNGLHVLSFFMMMPMKAAHWFLEYSYSYATCNETWMSLLKHVVIERMLSQAQGVLCVGHTAPGGWRLWSPAGATEGTDPLRAGHTTHHPRLSVRVCLAVMNHSFLT